MGISLIMSKNLAELKESALSNNHIRLVAKLPETQLVEILKYVALANSQLGQDLFVLSQTNLTRGGFFVEFGATNGKDLSNTLLLEKSFDWNGILAEPARVWHHDLKSNRSARIVEECVWKESGATLVFNETIDPELSTIDSFTDIDMHHASRKMGKNYKVNTISLIDLLVENDAPKKIDYLSIDTEGSEYDILKAFDFSKYRISIITVEHNFTTQRDDIFRLLTKNGYVRKFEDVSQFDDWYVLESNNH